MGSVQTHEAENSARLIESAGHYNAAIRMRGLAKERDELVAYIQDRVDPIIAAANNLIAARTDILLNGSMPAHADAKLSEAFVALDSALTPSNRTT